jgi:hypothetical protein
MISLICRSRSIVPRDRAQGLTDCDIFGFEPKLLEPQRVTTAVAPATPKWYGSCSMHSAAYNVK